jgi:protein ImuA
MKPLAGAKTDLIHELQNQVLSLQRAKKPLGDQPVKIGIPSMERAFPNQVFPIGAVHEFISKEPEDATATNGFIAGLASKLMQQNRICIWISTKRAIFPPALKLFGIEPEQIVFIDLSRQKDALWAIEEALKCEALAAVVGELRELSFTESRRMQLAVEKSNVTGFIHRINPRTENIVACVTRWKITTMASVVDDEMPGVGFPRWNVELLKVRNGKPGVWQIEWSFGSFRPFAKHAISIAESQTKKAG